MHAAAAAAATTTAATAAATSEAAATISEAATTTAAVAIATTATNAAAVRLLVAAAMAAAATMPAPLAPPTELPAHPTRSCTNPGRCHKPPRITRHSRLSARHRPNSRASTVEVPTTAPIVGPRPQQHAFALKVAGNLLQTAWSVTTTAPPRHPRSFPSRHSHPPYLCARQTWAPIPIQGRGDVGWLIVAAALARAGFVGVTARLLASLPAPGCLGDRGMLGWYLLARAHWW